MELLVNAANWIWQGCAVAVATAIMLRLLDRARGDARVFTCWAGLLTVLCLPLIPSTSTAPLLTVDASAVARSSGVPLDAWGPVAVCLLAAWALWFTVRGARLLTAFIALGRARHRCRPMPIACEEQLTHWVRMRRLGRPVRLFVCDDVRAAAVFGGGAPMIVVSPTLLERLSPDELDAVVLHEWTHVQRRDDLGHAIQRTVHAIAGWHPAVWWLDRRLAVEREMACDEVAVAVTGAGARYASCLTTLARLPTSALSQSAIGMLSAPMLTRRVERILSRVRVMSTGWSAGAACGCVVATTVLAFAVAGVRVVGMSSVAEVLERLPFVAQLHELPHVGMTSAGAIASQRAGARRAQARGERAMLADGARTAAAVASDEVASSPSPAPELLEAVPTRDAGLPGFVSTGGVLTGTAASAVAEPLSSYELVITTPSALTSVSGELKQRSVSPWGPAARAGVAIGQGSRQAGLATAGFFTRAGRRIAGSF